MPDAPRTSYVTILARNYLPKALALAESLRRHHPEQTLKVLIIDALHNEDLPDLAGRPDVELLSTEILGLSDREVLYFTMIYDLVEFATAVKPMLLKALLRDADQAAYLDPDTYVTEPMLELPVDLAESPGGILLTPHFLEPVAPGELMSEGHLLTVGVYNLGFCAVDRRAIPFLDWWWGHLRQECLFDPLSGLFVDQKWVDIGSTLFNATRWTHPGYNVSVANLHERPFVKDDRGLVIAETGQRLRLFHFHGFDTDRPEELSTRFDDIDAVRALNTAGIKALCGEYAERVLAHERDLGAVPDYPYWTDTSGRRITRQIRRAYRVESAGEPDRLPSPFLDADKEAYDGWHRRAWRPKLRGLVGDAAKSMRCALPEETARIKGAFPKLANAVRGKAVDNTGMWG